MSGFDLSNFLAAFFDEARDRLVSINRGLVEFESETIDEEGLITLRRDAHTIKGSALMLGVLDVGAVAHLFEDAMEHLIQNPELRVPKMTQFLYDLHDHLDERLEEVDTEPRLDSKALKVQYEELLKSVQTTPSEDTTPEVDDGYSMIGAEEAASWKKEHSNKTDSDDGFVETPFIEDTPLSDDIALLPIAAATPEQTSITDIQPDIDAMMPDGMFVEDSIDTLLIEPTGMDEAVVEFPIDDPIVLVEDDSDVVIELDDLDDVFTLGELDDGLDESSLEALLGDINSDDDLFVYGASGELSKNKIDENVQSAEDEQAQLQVAAELASQQAEAAATELARQQAEAAAAEQARQQAEATATKQARQQAEEAAAELARQQAEAAAAEQARQQAEAAAAKQARQQAEEAAAELARQQAKTAVAEQARQQAEATAAKQARQQTEATAAEQARQQAKEAAAEQARQQAKEAAAEQARQQAKEAAAEQARQQAKEAAAEQARQKPEVVGAESQGEQAATPNKLASDRAARELRKRDREARAEATKAKLAATQQVEQQATAAAAETLMKKTEPKHDNQRFRPESAGDGSTSHSSGQRQASGRFLRVDAARLEELSSFVVELSTERSRGEEVEVEFRGLLHEFRDLRVEWRALQRGMGEMPPEDQAVLMESMDRSFDQGMRKMSRFMENQRFSQMRGAMMLKELRDQVLSLMLRPLDNIFSTFPRAVRDVAVKLDKRVKLVVDGSSVEIDQGISEALVEPLVHLLNNAVSHGVELPDERKRLGKPPIAQVSIVARQNGSEIHIGVIDDGRGLDVELIKSTAVERGVTTQVEADQMDSAEILEMIFRPGFSTKKNVSDVSGRGIGMNVVQDAVRKLTGSIRIDSELGKGTRFLLSLPVSIAVQHALMFRMGTAYFGMLTHLVEQIVPMSPESVEKGTGGKDFIRYNNTLVALVDMREMLTEGDESSLSSRPYVIIAEHIEGFVGVVVDEMIDELEIVVRDLDPYIKRYQPQGLMGTTIAADGNVLILLEPYGIKEMGRTAPDQAITIEITEDEKMNNSVLLVEDSLIARQIEKSVFESIGFTVETAIDGLDGLEKLKKGTFDLVVTDLEMPRLDGFGFVRRIRNQPEYEELPIMVISTRESAEDRMRALEAGADAYMIKQQLQGDKILETVQALIGSVETA
ncbi:MAG: response regulator [Mariprofundaceae bacterium]|nr:response regulator [Mariprofundaceae bacterium]